MLRRVATILLMLAAACAISLVLSFAAAAWPGTWSDREVAAGESLTLQSGLSLTVPEGYTGYHMRYVKVPDWLPLGQNTDPTMPQLSETMSLSSNDGIQVMAVSYYSRDPQRLRELVVKSDTVEIYRTVRGRLVVVTTVPGKRKSYLFLHPSQGNDFSAIQKLWKQFHIKGAALPRGAG